MLIHGEMSCSGSMALLPPAGSISPGIVTVACQNRYLSATATVVLIFARWAA
ncbi:MAG: hypothetical protein J2P17_15515 [Mycobacterium sp.]|nr:hypothetical protein [Mycobacterium sp.]